MEISDAMQQGKNIHQDISNIVNKDKKLPDWAGKFKLNNPQSEIKLKVPYNELFDISAVIDLLDKPDFYEFKTGKTAITDWANDFQIPLYFLTLKLAQIDVRRAYLIHLNQYSHISDFIVVHNSIKAIEEAKNIIDTLGPEIHSYFEHEGIL